MSIRFLHVADLHLGSHLNARHHDSTEANETLGNAVFTAAERLFDVASAFSEVREILAGEDRGGYDDAAIAAIDPKALAGIDRANEAIDADL